jgi:hypothetical protein
MLQLDRQAQEQRGTVATQAREALETRRQIEEQGLQDQVDPSDDVDDDQQYDGPDADGHNDEFNARDREFNVAGEQVSSAQNQFGHAGTWFGAVDDQMGAVGVGMGVVGVGMRVASVGMGIACDRLDTRVAQFGHRTVPLQSRGTGIHARYNGFGADVFQM